MKFPPGEEGWDYNSKGPKIGYNTEIPRRFKIFTIKIFDIKIYTPNVDPIKAAEKIINQKSHFGNVSNSMPDMDKLKPEEIMHISSCYMLPKEKHADFIRIFKESAVKKVISYQQRDGENSFYYGRNPTELVDKTIVFTDCSLDQE